MLKRDPKKHLSAWSEDMARIDSLPRVLEVAVTSVKWATVHRVVGIYLMQASPKPGYSGDAHQRTVNTWIMVSRRAASLKASVTFETGYPGTCRHLARPVAACPWTGPNHSTVSRQRHWLCRKRAAKLAQVDAICDRNTWLRPSTVTSNRSGVPWRSVTWESLASRRA